MDQVDELPVPGEDILAHLCGGEHRRGLESPVVIDHAGPHAVVFEEPFIVGQQARPDLPDDAGDKVRFIHHHVAEILIPDQVDEVLQDPAGEDADEPAVAREPFGPFRDPAVIRRAGIRPGVGLEGCLVADEPHILRSGFAILLLRPRKFDEFRDPRRQAREIISVFEKTAHVLFQPRVDRIRPGRLPQHHLRGADEFKERRPPGFLALEDREEVLEIGLSQGFHHGIA